jgi:hypothetical protein
MIDTPACYNPLCNVCVKASRQMKQVSAHNLISNIQRPCLLGCATVWVGFESLNTVLLNENPAQFFWEFIFPSLHTSPQRGKFCSSIPAYIPATGEIFIF